MKFIHVLWGRKRRVRANIAHVQERAARAALKPRTGRVTPTGRPRV